LELGGHRGDDVMANPTVAPPASMFDEYIRIFVIFGHGVYCDLNPGKRKKPTKRYLVCPWE
jgi:hypothetical protein